MLKRLIIISGVLLATITSFAAQFKDVTHQQTFTVDLSIKDPNVISLNNDRIKQYSAVKGAATASIDQDSGILSLMPTITNLNKPFSMIIFSEKGYRYTLISNPKSIPAQDIVLNNSEINNQEVANKAGSNNTAEIISLIKAMMNNDRLEGYRRQVMLEETKDDNTALITKYIGNKLIGEVLLLKNTNEKDFTLKGEDFYSDGVFAVSLASSTVKPGHNVKVYRVVQHG